MNSIDALKWRYATKKFDQEKILPPEKIQLLKKAFNLTATSYGLQPLKLVVVHDKELQKNLYKVSYFQQQISTASHVLVLCIEKEVGKAFIENYFEHVQDIRKTPRDILSPYLDSLVNDFENKPQNEIKVWATHQAYLVLGSLLTVCAIEGIDASPMEGFESEKYDKLLGLDKHNLNSVLVLPVGYRSEDDMFSRLKKVRRPLQDTVIEINSVVKD
ncbi:MAG TPA: NAD(P)H-dependent oxidoreductase [Salinimicrobium sp.]|nr:NAD(P)H-dependent oxidoreductase [Salinimicrobium sp.]